MHEKQLSVNETAEFIFSRDFVVFHSALFRCYIGEASSSHSNDKLGQDESDVAVCTNPCTKIETLKSFKIQK